MILRIYNSAKGVKQSKWFFKRRTKLEDVYYLLSRFTIDLNVRVKTINVLGQNIGEKNLCNLMKVRVYLDKIQIKTEVSINWT